MLKKKIPCIGEGDPKCWVCLKLFIFHAPPSKRTGSAASSCYLLKYTTVIGVYTCHCLWPFDC